MECGIKSARVALNEEENVFIQIALQLLLWNCFIMTFQPFPSAHAQSEVCIISLYERLP